MPKYEYACKDCGEHLEVVQAFTDEPLTECRACGGPLRKVFGNIGVVFKGSGFYKNDSREKSKANGARADKDKGDKAEKGEKVDKSASVGASGSGDAKSGSSGDSKSDSSSGSKSSDKSSSGSGSSSTSGSGPGKPDSKAAAKSA